MSSIAEQAKDLLKDCKYKDIEKYYDIYDVYDENYDGSTGIKILVPKNKQYYDMYDVYDVDCDDGTYGDKILIPKNKKMNNIHNK